MKIRTVKTFPLLYRLPKPYGDANGMKKYRTSYMIRIETDSGVCGWGECVDSLNTLQDAFHSGIIPYLLGQAAFDRRRLVHSIKKRNAYAASAVSMAMTQIMATHAGLNVCELWGGKYRDKVPVYASFQSYSDSADWQKHSLLAVEQAAEAGFSAFKVKIGGKPIAEDKQHIASLQEVLSGEHHLALDANQSYDMLAALEWRTLLERHSNWLWCEEPLQMKYSAEYGQLRQLLSVPLAGGENIASAADYLPLFTNHAIDFINPDPQHIAGLDEYRETLSMARTFGIRATPHSFDGALSRLYALFAQACLEPFSKMVPDVVEPVEWDVMDNPFTRMLRIEPINGEVTLPTGVGIGLEIDTELLSFYKWDGSSYE